MSWIELRAEFAERPADWAPMIEAFLVHGCDHTLTTDAPPAISACLVDSEVGTELANSLSESLMALGAASVTTAPYAELDWQEVWKQHFKPLQIGEHLYIRASWHDPSTSLERQEIVLDPGQAFGTGDHPTTRMCLELLERSNLHGRVLDLGCGSGILGIAASKLGASDVVCIDIEPVSVSVCKENALANGAEIECIVSDGIPDAIGPFDLVISNIISAALIRMAPSVRNALGVPGIWIVSGILEANWPDVLKAAERSGFKLIERKEVDQWVAATLQV